MRRRLPARDLALAFIQHMTGRGREVATCLKKGLSRGNVVKSNRPGPTLSTKPLRYLFSGLPPAQQQIANSRDTLMTTLLRDRQRSPRCCRLVGPTAPSAADGPEHVLRHLDHHIADGQVRRRHARGHASVKGLFSPMLHIGTRKLRPASRCSDPFIGGCRSERAGDRRPQPDGHLGPVESQRRRGDRDPCCCATGSCTSTWPGFSGSTHGPAELMSPVRRHPCRRVRHRTRSHSDFLFRCLPHLKVASCPAKMCLGFV